MIKSSGETQLLQLPRISALKNGTKGVNKAERRAYFYPTVSVIAEPSEDGAEHDIQEVLVRDIKYSLSLEGKDSAPSRQTSKSTILQASSERLPSKNRPLPVTATIESKGQQFLCLPLTGKEDRIDTPIHSPKSSQLAVNSPSAPIPKQNVGDPSRKVPCPHEHCTHCLTDLAALSASFNFPSVPQADFTPHYVDQATSIAGLAASLPRATQEDEQPHPSLPSVQLKSVTSNATVSRVTRVMLPEDHRAGWEVSKQSNISGLARTC